MNFESILKLAIDANHAFIVKAKDFILNFTMEDGEVSYQHIVLLSLASLVIMNYLPLVMILLTLSFLADAFLFKPTKEESEDE